MATVLVTGATGLLGTTLCPLLAAAGHQVVRLCRGGDVDLRVDLAERAETHAALARCAPDAIVNLAALTNVDECERQPRAAYRANVRTVENIADWMGGRDCHLVQISTDQVYDGAGPHREDDVTLTNYYAFSKYAAELATRGISATVLRTNFFGPSRCAGRASLSDWLAASLKRGDPITVFDDVLFSPLSLQRLAELIERALSRRPRGTFNLGSREGLSKADFAFALAGVLDLPPGSMRRGSSRGLALAAYRPQDMRMDPSRAEAALGVTLPTLLEEIQTMKAAYAQQAR